MHLAKIRKFLKKSRENTFYYIKVSGIASGNKLITRRIFAFTRALEADHLTLEGGGDFEKNFLQALVGRKKLHAAQMI